MTMTSARVLLNYYTIAGLYTLAAASIWGVNTLFLLDAGLDIFEVFLANTAFTAGSVLFEIPTGVLADTKGRRLSFLLSVIILLFSTLAYVGVADLNGTVAPFILVSVVMGLGFTFYSGAVEAWLVDALKATNYQGQLDRVFARGAMVTGVAMLFGTVGGGLLGSVDLALPYLARAGMLAAVLGIAFFGMRDLGFRARKLKLGDLPGEMQQVARNSIRYGWNKQSLRLLMIYSALIYGFLSWGFYAWQPHLLELLGQDAVWVAGVVAALISLSTVAGNGLVDWLSQYCGRRSTLLIWAAGVQAFAAIGFGLTDSFWLAVGLFLLITLSMGVSGPVKQAFLHQVIPSEQRASVISFDSMVASAGGVVGQSGLGYLARARSIADGYILGGLGPLFAIPVLWAVRRLNDGADSFAGEKAGVRRSCEPQGIPAISGVDATPVDVARRR